MYKNLLPLTKNLGKDFYYRLQDFADYLAGKEYFDGVESSLSEEEKSYYLKFLKSIVVEGLPSSKDEYYNRANLNKLYSIDILSLDSKTLNDHFSWLSRFDFLSDRENSMVCCDGEMITSNDIDLKKSRVTTYCKARSNFRQREYYSYFDKLHGFGKFIVPASKYHNIAIIKNQKKEDTIHIDYSNSCDDPILETNANIIDIRQDSTADLFETVKLSAGQMNYIIYVVRENATLNLKRDTHTRNSGWSVFDSVFICYPNSKVNIETSHPGTQYSQENFFVELTENCTLSLNGRNKIAPGSQLHTIVDVISQSKNNTCSVDTRNIGQENSDSSFIGKFYVNKDSENFVGSMKNPNLMVSNKTTMHTRPILDIETKDIECTHGCTISTVNDDSMYYLQSKGLSKTDAEKLLIESFLC